MKETFLVCTAVSVAVSILKIILDALCRTGVSKVLQISLDIFLLSVLVGTFFGIEYSGYGVTDIASEDFSAIESRTVSEIKAEAEKLLSERVTEAVEKEFGKRPSRCISEIDIETLEVCKLYVYFDGGFVSGYDVKKFLKEKYNVNAEVIFL